MHPRPLPLALQDLPRIVTPVLQRVYDINAGRHDDLVGDDSQTFAFHVYRNSWFQLEQAFEAEPDWQTARPDQSLRITNGLHSIHVYRAGADEKIDIHALRLDADAESLTKRSIAANNRNQLALALFPETHNGDDTLDPEELFELVILHAGNPDDGLCGVWIGAPVATGVISASPWAWVTEVWSIDRPTLTQSFKDLSSTLRHDELPEPDLDLGHIDEEGESAAGEL